MGKKTMFDDVDTFDFDEFCGLKVGCAKNTINWDNLRQGDLNAIGSKMTAFITYFTYFSNIAMSLFKYTSTTAIPTDYIERAMFQDGRLAFFNGKEFDMLDDVSASTFNWGDKFNHYGEITEIELHNTLPNTSNALNGKKLTNSVEDGRTFEILYANKTRTSLSPIVWYFCSKIMEQQTAIDQNLANNSLPVAVECTKEQILALNNIIKDIANQRRFLFFRKDKNARPEELFKALDLNIEFKADKMLDVVNYYKGEFYTMLGINSTPFEKKERLLRDEVKSNNQILNLTLYSMLQTQRECFERINATFGTDFTVDISIDIDTTTDDITSLDDNSTIEGGDIE